MQICFPDNSWKEFITLEDLCCVYYYVSLLHLHAHSNLGNHPSSVITALSSFQQAVVWIQIYFLRDISLPDMQCKMAKKTLQMMLKHNLGESCIFKKSFPMQSGTLLPSSRQSTCDPWLPNARPGSLQQTVKEQSEQREPGYHFRKSRAVFTWNWFQTLWDRLQQGTQIWPSTPTTQPRLEYFHFCWLRKLKTCHAHKHKQMVHLITSLAVHCTMGNHVAFFRIQFNYKEMEITLLLADRQRQIRSIRKRSAEDRWRKHIREAYLSECDWKNNSYLNYKKKRGQKNGVRSEEETN